MNIYYVSAEGNYAPSLLGSLMITSLTYVRYEKCENYHISAQKISLAYFLVRTLIMINSTFQHIVENEARNTNPHVHGLDRPYAPTGTLVSGKCFEAVVVYKCFGR